MIMNMSLFLLAILKLLYCKIVMLQNSVLQYFGKTELYFLSYGFKTPHILEFNSYDTSIFV